MATIEEKSITLDTLIKTVLSYNSEANTERLKSAYEFASKVHADQKRVAGGPYTEHLLAVAMTLAQMKMDSITIAAGLLHDSVEDTATTVDEIAERFGKDIAFLVEGLTKLSMMEFKTKKEAQAENFRKMLLAMAKDIRIILIKFADRLHNMRTLQYLPEHKRQRIALETLEIYAPLANRLGIGWLKTEFEDLSFKFLMPEVYEDIASKVAKRKEEQEGYLNEVMRIIEEKLKEQGLSGKVFGRVKHNYGIYQKMQKQGIPFEQVYDVLGLRIITDTKANCYAILGLIHSLWTPVPGRFKDYIGAPKSNLYQSLHTTVVGPKGEKVEFQIRTEEMDKIAEEGIASHWKYKEKGHIREKDSKYFAWLRELAQSQKELPDAQEFLEIFKGDIFPEVVYVFTPQGDVMELPVDSTPIDFAYSIHTQVGHQCIGARVNGKIVPLRYHLRNGDTVEIITSQGHGPSRDWLKVVKTPRAKTRIKQWIKTEERKRSIELGTELLEREFRKHDLSPNLIKSKDTLNIVKDLGINNLEDLLVAIGYGKLSAHHVVNRFIPEKAAEVETVKKEQKHSAVQGGIRMKGVDNILFHFSKCCFPIPGDKIVGFVTRGKGVSIHTADCPNLESLAVDKDRLIDVSWEVGADTTQPVRVYVDTIDAPGILANLTSVISAAGVNISHVEAVTSNTTKNARINFILQVADKQQLDGIIKKLINISGVTGVKRVKTA